MIETKAEEIARLQREIAERMMRLQFLVCGDQREGVSAQSAAAETQRQESGT